MAAARPVLGNDESLHEASSQPGHRVLLMPDAVGWHFGADGDIRAFVLPEQLSG
jgi:hypothetical protein